MVQGGALVSDVYTDKGEVSWWDCPSDHPVLFTPMKPLFKGGKRPSSHLSASRDGAKPLEGNERVLRPKLESVQKKKVIVLNVGKRLGCVRAHVHRMLHLFLHLTSVYWGPATCWALSQVQGLHHHHPTPLTSSVHRRWTVLREWEMLWGQ